MKFNRTGAIGKVFFTAIAHYDYDKYWKMRDIVVENTPKKNILVRMFCLLKVKRMEALNAASYGTALGAGAHFKSHPIMPHGLTGSFISHTAVIGENCTIMQNVIIGSSKKVAPTIGDNCVIGAGAIIIGGIKIGNNVHIGAGCIVHRDIPDNCTVVMPEPRIISRTAEEQNNRGWVF